MSVEIVVIKQIEVLLEVDAKTEAEALKIYKKEGIASDKIKGYDLGGFKAERGEGR